MQIVTSAVRVICAYIVSRVLHEFQSNKVLGIKLGQVHPSEADIDTNFEIFSLLLVRLVSLAC